MRVLNQWCEMLSDRHWKVLRAVVQTYIGMPYPVGSRLVTKRYGFSLSPATIRNVMADLEEMGYLIQPHTSAGRIPTDKAYRLYVDSLKQRGQADDELAQSLRESFRSLRDDMNRLLAEATRVLSSWSHCLAFAIPARADGATLNRIQFYNYMNQKTVALLITNEGLIANKVLESNFGFTQRELNRLADYLNSEFSGSTIDQIRTRLLKEMSKERALCDMLISRAMNICEEALSFPGEDIFFSGISELIGLPELSDRINDITRAIEDKHWIVRLLEELASPEGVRVVIGSENPERNMQDLSIVSARYRRGEQLLGVVGMIGPTRMDYPKSILMVDALARSISGTISR